MRVSANAVDEDAAQADELGAAPLSQGAAPDAAIQWNLRALRPLLEYSDVLTEYYVARRILTAAAGHGVRVDTYAI